MSNPTADFSPEVQQLIAENSVQAENRDGLAEFHMGVAYHTAYIEGACKDATAAATWYKAAWEHGHNVAGFYLASLYETGVSGVPQNIPQAVSIYREIETRPVPVAANAEMRLNAIKQAGSLAALKL